MLGATPDKGTVAAVDVAEGKSRKRDVAKREFDRKHSPYPGDMLSCPKYLRAHHDEPAGT
jgi:hypothetical protein